MVDICNPSTVTMCWQADPHGPAHLEQAAWQKQQERPRQNKEEVVL